MKDYKVMFEEFKAKHPSALVMFRKGDWFIMIDDDAEVASKELSIPLYSAIGKHKKEVNMSTKDLDRFLPRLVKNGHRIAILDYE